MSQPPKLEKLPFRRVKTVGQCVSAGQLIGLRIIGQFTLSLPEN